MAISTIKDIKKYFHDEDVYWRITKNTHPLYDYLNRCAGITFVRRFEDNGIEMIFLCRKDKGMHIVRECKETCPDYVMCQHVTAITKVEKVAEDYVNKKTE